VTKVLALLGKGGTAKTTSAASLADCFSRRGLQVLVVDLDVQTSLTDWLAPSDERSVDGTNVILGEAKLAEAAVPLTDTLTLLPAVAANMLRLEQTIEKIPRRREAVLATWAAKQTGFDLIVLDTPRGLAGALSINALEAADSVVIPLDPAGMGLDALWEQLELVEVFAGDRGVSQLLSGVLPTRVPRTNMASLAISEVDSSKYPLLPSVPAATAVAEAVSARQLIATYAPNSPAVAAYETVADALSTTLKKES
jgi:chromosome partitioning protein